MCCMRIYSLACPACGWSGERWIGDVRMGSEMRCPECDAECSERKDGKLAESTGENLKNFFGIVKESVESAGERLKEKIEDISKHENTKVAVRWLGDTATKTANEAGKLGKEVIQSEMAKDVAGGAAVGALIAVPIPVIGPAIGAVIGAGLGVYKNISKAQKREPSLMTPTHPSAGTRGGEYLEVSTELIKLDELRQKGIINDAEFDDQKKKILARS